jgi:hypothetical protein
MPTMLKSFQPICYSNEMLELKSVLQTKEEASLDISPCQTSRISQLSYWKQALLRYTTKSKFQEICRI